MTLKTLLISHGKDIDDSLFYAVCYAIRFVKTEKLEKCCNDELKTDLPDKLFFMVFLLFV